MALVFSEQWANELRAQLQSSETYAQAAARWEGGLLMRLSGEETAHGVYLDLLHGDCREARPAGPGDEDLARFVLTATKDSWQKVFQGELAPINAVMRGLLKLEKGSTFELLPHVKAAEELLQAAQEVVTHFPGEASDVDLDEAASSEGEESSRGDLATERSFRITRSNGLDFHSPILRLWSKAKRDGIWNPEDIDLSADRQDWLALADNERDLLLRLAALFGAGEESVVVDLLPLIQVVAAEGRVDEEIYLTSFLWEEAKHVEAFRRFFDQVAQDDSDLSRYHSESYKTIFYRELPKAMGRLNEDASPVAQAEASTTYNLIVEGVLAETGYYVYGRILKERGILPGMQQVIQKLAMDESRHLAYGVYLLSRLVAQHGEPVWEAIEARMNRLLPAATGVVEEAFNAYDPKNIPFGLGLEPFMDYAVTQFEKRLKRVELARRQDLEQIVGKSRLVEESEATAATAMGHEA